MSDKTPIAFMSYVTFDDKHENGRLTQLRERLSAEVRLQTGEEFPIFQDRFSVEWGQDWQERIDDSLDSVTFLIPIITPGFFKSPYCRDELQRFLEREQQLQRKDLILPIYYVDTPTLNDSAQRAVDKLAEAIATRQYVDWRDLRFEPFTSPPIAKMLAEMAVQIRNALGRVRPSKSSVVANVSTSTTSSPNETSSTQTPEQDMALESEHTKHAPVPKTEPPVIVVDPAGQGDYLSISDAIEAESNPILRRNRIHDGQASGVLVYKNGKGTLEDNGIFANARAGVAIKEGGNPTLRRNLIHDGKQGGVFVYENGKGTLEKNDIFANTRAGVEIKAEGNPTLRRNLIHDGQASGVFVQKNGQGILEENDISANASAGVVIETGATPNLQHNRINRNGDVGVQISRLGGGTIEDNDLRDNAKGAWDISRDSERKVTRARNRE